MDTVIILSFAFAVGMILVGIRRLLTYLDLKKDYSGEKIRYFVKPIDGTDCLLVPYFTWQKGKLAEIKKRYEKEFEYEGRKYILGVGHSDFRFPKGDSMDYLFTAYYRAFLTPKDHIGTVSNQIFAPHIEAEICNAIQNQGGSVILSNPIYINEIEMSIEKILLSLNEIQNVPQEIVSSVRDDLETVIEQVKSDNPKKIRIQKALENIKKFASEFALNLSVEMATGLVTKADWSAVIEKMTNFIGAL